MDLQMHKNTNLNKMINIAGINHSIIQIERCINRLRLLENIQFNDQIDGVLQVTCLEVICCDFN